MFSDPIPLVKHVLNTPVALETSQLFVTDVGPGSSTREGVLYASEIEGFNGDYTSKLAIAHQATKENGSIPTTRSSVRLELSKILDGVPNPVRGHVTVVFALPGQGFGVGELSDAFRVLACTLLCTRAGQHTAGDAERTVASAIMRGEP